MTNNIKNFKCLGIDPGLARVGFGYVIKSEDNIFYSDEYGCIETKSSLGFNNRIIKVYDTITEHIKKNQPDIISIERLFFGRNVSSAANVYQARGVILLAAAQNNINVMELWPAQIKLLICGTGKAKKIEVQNKVRDILKLEKIPKPDDTADALACAIAGINLLRDEKIK